MSKAVERSATPLIHRKRRTFDNVSILPANRSFLRFQALRPRKNPFLTFLLIWTSIAEKHPRFLPGSHTHLQRLRLFRVALHCAQTVSQRFRSIKACGSPRQDFILRNHRVVRIADVRFLPFSCSSGFSFIEKSSVGRSNCSLPFVFLTFIRSKSLSNLPCFYRSFSEYQL